VRGLRAAGACCVAVVDAGSTDATQRLAREAGALVLEERRRGYGLACQTGAEAVRGHELVAFLDGDGSCDPADLPRLAAAAHDADVVLGRRLEVARGAMPWHAALGNALVSAVIRRRTGRPVHDLPPAKVLRRDALQALGLDELGYGWTVQLVGRALAHPALRVVEVPAAFLPRAGGESKVSGRLGPSLRAGRAMLRHAVGATRRRGVLVLMAKAPRRGHSKTRLANGLGAEAAEGFWTACLRDAGRRVLAAGRVAGLDVMAMTPSAADAVRVRELTGLPCLVQRRPGLGEALLEVSSLTAPFTIAVSADAPTLPACLVLDAAGALRSAPVVLGPGEDGGYYLVGLRRGVSLARRRQAFLGVRMGGADVLEHTSAALGDPVRLAAWPDVDTAADLERLAGQLADDPSAAPAVAAWLSALQCAKEAG
ncbi:MAG TPA: DUF2064 domain-containing protein, partial [Candidatus Dormibacteraeota bacterium]